MTKIEQVPCHHVSGSFVVHSDAGSNNDKGNIPRAHGRDNFRIVTKRRRQNDGFTLPRSTG
jgi:hypothetical protein